MAGKALLVAALGTLVLFTGCDDQLGTTVGPEGGFIVSDDGRMTIEFPAGALDKRTTLHLDPTLLDRTDAIIGYEIAPRGTTLARPAVVTYDWATDADADDAQGAVLRAGAPDGVTLAMRGADGWAALADQDVDEEGALTEASLLYFAPIAVLPAA